MNRVIKVTKLQLNKRDVSFFVPFSILMMVLVITGVIAFALQRAGLDPASADYADGARGNLGMVLSLPGFLVYYGVQGVATTFPFAMALGTTRRSYVLGTAVANLITSLYIATMMLVLLWIELATNHWFFGLYALDNYAFGSGNGLVLFVAAFLGTFVSTSLGGLFGAVWVRYGSRGPTILGLGLAFVFAALLLIFVPYLGEIIAATTGPMLVAIGVAIAALCLLGTWGSMRRTAVR